MGWPGPPFHRLPSGTPTESPSRHGCVGDYGSIRDGALWGCAAPELTAPGMGCPSQDALARGAPGTGQVRRLQYRGQWVDTVVAKRQLAICVTETSALHPGHRPRPRPRNSVASSAATDRPAGRKRRVRPRLARCFLLLLLRPPSSFAKVSASPPRPPRRLVQLPLAHVAASGPAPLGNR